MAKQEGTGKGGGEDQPDSAKLPKESSKSSLAPKAEEIMRASSPKHEIADRRGSGQAGLGQGNPTPCERSMPESA